MPYGQAKRYAKGLRFPLVHDGIRLCYILLTGSMEVHRNNDGLLIVTVAAPGIVGLGVHDAFIVTTEPSSFAILRVDEAYCIIDEKGLWETLSRHMMVQSNKLYSYSRQLSAPTVYEVICNQLMELINEPESIRANISVERYIREKTHVSRSSIMKILAELRKGSYVTIEEGRLIAIRHLPSKY
ncbi:helix-turn-helix domain-containing protein [Enterobacter ludwigii]|nr:helix-turn-helix domain-containing protein [Enterobacter ludwigii]